MPKKKVEVRVKRENWNHKYRVVARRSNGQMVSNRGWHTAHDRQAVVDKVFTFQEGARYHYLVRGQLATGEYRSMTITSSTALHTKEHSYEREYLFNEIKKKYEKRRIGHSPEIVNLTFLSRTDLDTREKKVYAK